MLSVDELIERVDAVTADDVVELVRELLAPERLSAAGDRPRTRTPSAPRSTPIAPALAEAA